LKNIHPNPSDFKFPVADGPAGKLPPRMTASPQARVSAVASGQLHQQTLQKFRPCGHYESTSDPGAVGGGANAGGRRFLAAKKSHPLREEPYVARPIG